jgi:hypothetical protein
MENTTTKTSWGIFITVLAWVCITLGLVAAAYGIYVTDHDEGKFSLQNLSSFDSYAQGAVASLWSLGALFFLYATLLAQRQQIAQQERQIDQQQFQFKQDMEKRKVENAQQEEQFESQQQAIRLQNFEASFFQLLQIFSHIIGDLVDYRQLRKNMAEIETLKYERRQCFTLWHILMIEGFDDSALEKIANVRLPTVDVDEYLVQSKDNPPVNPLPPPRTDQLIVKLYYEKFYNHRQALLGHYFRILYHIVKLVDSSTILKTHEEKRRYVSLVRAQLSAHELILIFYNGISTKAVKFKPLIEKYGLLEHLDKKLLLDQSHVHFHKPGAYK